MRGNGNSLPRHYLQSVTMVYLDYDTNTQNRREPQATEVTMREDSIWGQYQITRDTT